MKILDKISTEQGILQCDGKFEEVLRDNLNGLKGFHRGLPVVLSGMITSRNGWVEVPYATLPASAADLSCATKQVTLPNLGPLWFIPGIKAEGAQADVMRGEETEILGAISHFNLRDATIIIPGSHSKHTIIRDGAIRSFRTYLTGEMFSALTKSTILGAFGSKTCETGCSWFEEGIRIGARQGGAGALLNRVFSARSRVLVDGMPEEHAACCLSGLLIGAELSEAIATSQDTLWILGNGRLPELYQRGFSVLGATSKIVPHGSAAFGAAQVARALNLIQ
ncbi:2-dehydro-3-deoxygalactonokinase (plasmid) [Pseudovibrio brasiliensis]|uniref:2-dehydro-3-deoxygalactonokinase n=2 Tax=Pseudovibrio brasiliensis TaxID=1898042 RepID=A0ABX8AY24_9HYPH|nr:2-dehydro-3-deoxygalactonokinase [Pseudovibrio brasiliensis]